jgi:hypothetical protein
MTIYKIVKWEIYQHYKDRNPPWIKLHTELLNSKTWVMLDDASRVLAIATMLIAARNNTNGEFDDDPVFFQKVAFLNQKPNFQPLVNIGFIEVVHTDASNMLATCKQSASPEKRRVETETETETENKKHEPQPAVANKKTKRDEIDTFTFSKEFEEAFVLYPHRQGDGDLKDKHDTWRKWTKIIQNKSTIDGIFVNEEKLLECIKNYNEERRMLNREAEWPFRITNFFGCAAYYKKYLIKKPIKINEANNGTRNTNHRTTATEHHANVVRAARAMPLDGSLGRAEEGEVSF